MSTSGWWTHLMLLPAARFSREPHRQLQMPAALQQQHSRQRKPASKARGHKITNPTFMFANGLLWLSRGLPWSCPHFSTIDGSVIENCCGELALVSHIWIMAKPLKHENAYKLAAIQTWNPTPLVFLNPVCGPSPPENSPPTGTCSLPPVVTPSSSSTS